MSKHLCPLDGPPPVPRNYKFALIVSGPLAARIRDLAVESRAKSPQRWCQEALEYMVLEHRSNKFRPDPLRHYARNGDDWSDEEMRGI